MQVNSVGQNIGSIRTNRLKAENNNNKQPQAQGAKSVAFTGAPNPIVGLMDFIAAGGYAASFCIQDGLGFIAPRVGKGLLRGGKKKHDENGNEILDKNGEPKRELNWAYARKEGIREIITGPSAFIIPWFLLKGINKRFGSGNSVRLDYIDGFKKPFQDFVENNVDAVKEGTSNKKEFYKDVFKDVLEKSINAQTDTKIEDIDKVADRLAEKQIKTEEILSDKKYKGRKNKKVRNEALAKYSVEDDFMALRKKYVGGTANDMAISITASDGKTAKHGSIGELTTAMRNYFDDAVKNVHDALKTSKDGKIAEKVEEALTHFTKRRMGSRVLTNLGLFATVAIFYTQIPKLYNMGTHGKNPALMNDEEPALAANSNNAKTGKTETKKDVSFSGNFSNLEKLGNKVFTTPKIKSLSDVFELNGPIIQGNAMAALLYGACIPPRLKNAQDKYDFGEILLRDFTAFTALLFGAKALARIFSDGFTKLTGLALNKRDTDGLSFFKKAWAYLNPADKHHSILTSKQLDYKYTDIENYKGGVSGFTDFIEGSHGNTKKALSIDENVKAAAEKIVKKITGKSYAEADNKEIIEALNKAKTQAPEELKEFYKCFSSKNEKLNKLVNRAKTCNSLFGALSTLVLVPVLIISLTDICKKMTEKRQAKEKQIKTDTQAQQAPLIPSNKPTMAGFLNKTAA